MSLSFAFNRWRRRRGAEEAPDGHARADQVAKRLDRQDKRVARVNEILDRQATQVAAADSAIDELRKAVATLQESVDAATGRAQVLAEARRRDLAALDAVRRFEAELEGEAPVIAAHVEQALASATVSTDPFPHAVVEPLLPPALFERLLASLPSGVYWQSSGRSRDYWEVETDVGPWDTEVLWRFLDRRIVDRVLRPVAVGRFRHLLDEHWQRGFGIDGSTVTYRTVEGRLQRRRWGYTLRPHLDPPHAALTGLFYLAKPGDDPQHGTKLYRPSSPLPARRLGIFYPEDNGIALEHVQTVPFRPNTLLLWMTPVGTHGADLAGESVPKSIERFTYQFQIAVDKRTGARLKAT